MKAEKKTQLSSRAPLERMLFIHQKIQSGKFPNATSLAGDLEVSPKSVHRDLEFMRDRMMLPLEYSEANKGYRYTQEVSAFPTMQITEGELFALLVAEKALQQYRGTTFEKPLFSAIKKLESSLPNTISVNMGEVEQTISFRTSAEQIVNLEIFEKLSNAAARRQQLKMDYRKPGKREIEHRLVDPYQLANINAEWFLFAYDHDRQDFRRFVPARIQKLEPTGKTFVRSPQFSLEKQLRDSFGVHSAEGEFNVVVRFDESVADYIREKKWHSSQQLRELKSGGVELSMKLSSLSEIHRWILSWGGNAVVVQPAKLKEMVRESAGLLLKGA